MKLKTIVTEYIDLKQSMGMRFHSMAVILRAFCKAAGDLNIEDVSPVTVSAYLQGNSPTLTSFWHLKHDALKGFYRYAIGRGYLNSPPLPSTIPKRPNSFSPYIYTLQEYQNLLRATTHLDSRRGKVDGLTFRALLILLFNTGLRISEAINLVIADFSSVSNLLTIRESKFYKTRLVPIHPKLSDILCRYIVQRHTSSVSEALPLFTNRDGSPLRLGTIEQSFRWLCNCCGIRKKEGGRFQPRLHDVRHTFSVNRLLEWYRLGADVQRLLPYLSTYLGHLNIDATQRYLTMTPELLEVANRRFERYAVQEVTHG